MDHEPYIGVMYGAFGLILIINFYLKFSKELKLNHGVHRYIDILLDSSSTVVKTKPLEFSIAMLIPH